MSEIATAERPTIEIEHTADPKSKGEVAASCAPSSTVAAVTAGQQAGGFMGLISQAVTAGNFDLVERMMAAQERWEANEARKAFNNALAAAKAKIKPITKNRHVGFDGKNEGSTRVDYNHEDLAGIASEIDEILANEGLFYRWVPTNDYANGMVTVTCRVSHRLGHSEDFTLSAKVDAGAGKNHLQAVGSAVTYLERYTLKSALGLASKHDDDGRAAGKVAEEVDSTPLSKAQATSLDALIDSREVPRVAFMKWVQQRVAPDAKTFADIPAAKFQMCVDKINKLYPEKKG